MQYHPPGGGHADYSEKFTADDWKRIANEMGLGVFTNGAVAERAVKNKLRGTIGLSAFLLGDVSNADADWLRWCSVFADIMHNRGGFAQHVVRQNKDSFVAKRGSMVL